MSDDFNQKCRRIIKDLGLAEEGIPSHIRPLSGGVSSDIAVVTIGDRKICIKSALATLRVDELWEAPVGRNKTEYEWLSFVSDFLPEAVPVLYGHSSSYNGFAMSYMAPETYPNWKSELMAGRVDVSFTSDVGTKLGIIHQKSTQMELTFAYQDDFRALRLDPYLYFTAKKYPDLSKALHQIGDSLYGARIALVHGDVSPKNILMGKDGPVFLDAECAVLGDPCFDLAFCINHLVIKAIVNVASRPALRESIFGLWGNYKRHVSWEEVSALEERVCRLLPALMLARVDGKSPVEYHNAISEDIIRRISIELLRRPVVSLDVLLSKIWANLN